MDLTLISQLAGHIVRRVPEIVIPTTVGGLLFWAVMILVWSQYRRLATMERRIHGFVRNDPWSSTGTALVFGVGAGVIGSLLLVTLGITLSPDDIIYLWPVALVLLLVNPRLLCFSYAGGLVSVVHLVTGWPPAVNPAAIMGLVAILHLMEGVLVAINGYGVASAVYLRNGRRDVVGGYLIQRFWPIPIMIIFLLQVPPESIASGFSMPDWWPLIGTGGDLGPNWAYVMTPVVAALGYSDIALTEMPSRRARRTALQLVVFSVALLGLSLAAGRWGGWVWAAALFGPVAHELMIRHSSGREMDGEPRFLTGPGGVMVMDLRPGEPGEKMGLRPGDVIRKVNDIEVTTREGLRQAVVASGWYLELGVLGPGGGEHTLESNRHPPGRSLGLVTAPEPGDGPHVNLGGSGPLGRLGKRMWRRIRGRRPRT